MRSWIYSDYTGKTRALHWDNILLGIGPGTFPRISVLIDKFTHPLIIFLHNEFEQIPWEYGMTALILALAVYARALWQARGDRPLFISLVSLSAFCFFWHPLHFFFSATMVGLLIFEGLVTRTERTYVGNLEARARSILFSFP